MKMMKIFACIFAVFAIGKTAVVEDEKLKNTLIALNTDAEQQLWEKKLESVTEQNQKIQLDSNTDPEVLRKKINLSQEKVPDTSEKVCSTNVFRNLPLPELNTRCKLDSFKYLVFFLIFPSIINVDIARLVIFSVQYF